MTAPVLGNVQRSTMLSMLADQLAFIQSIDPSNPDAQGYGMEEEQRYALRNRMVMMAVAYAAALDFPAGYRHEPEQPERPVAYIELPTGQVSWHLPEYTGIYDLHSTADKYDRITAYLAAWPLL